MKMKEEPVSTPVKQEQIEHTIPEKKITPNVMEVPVPNYMFYPSAYQIPMPFPPFMMPNFQQSQFSNSLVFPPQKPLMTNPYNILPTTQSHSVSSPLPMLTPRKPSSTITSPNQQTESFNTLQLLADEATANSACNEKDNTGV